MFVKTTQHNSNSRFALSHIRFCGIVVAHQVATTTLQNPFARECEAAIRVVLCWGGLGTGIAKGLVPEIGLGLQKGKICPKKSSSRESSYHKNEERLGMKGCAGEYGGTGGTY